MKATQRLLLLAVPFALLLLLAAEARACSCIEYGTPPCAAYWGADAVFTGYVTDIKKLPDPSANGLPKALLHFIVDEPYRGIAGSEIDVATLSGTSCDIKFEKGERWLVYAYRDEANNRLEIVPCTRTNRLEYANEDLDYIYRLKQKVPAQTISGKVLQNNYKPLIGVKVTIEGSGNKAETITDNEGIYTIALPQSGIYTVRAIVPFAAAVLPHRADENIEVHPTDEQTVVEYKVNIPERQCNYKELEVFEVDLHATAEVSGKVLDKSGQPITLGYLYLVSADEASDKNFLKIEENGNFKFEGVAAGRYFLVINPDDSPPGENDAPYQRTFYPGVSGSSQATPIAVSEGAKLENLLFQIGSPFKARVLTGTVVWTDGRAAQNAYVSLYDGATNRYIRMVKTDAKGSFITRLYGDFKYEIEAGMAGGLRGKGERTKVPSTGKLQPLRLVIKRE